LILDDISYVRKDQAETSVLFELISARYERRSLFITANKPFGQYEPLARIGALRADGQEVPQLDLRHMN
jgi:DNA replication protein DnaC